MHQEARTKDPKLPGVEQEDPELERRLRAELTRRGPDYKPRTHHLREDGSPKYVNRLICETSPYLLQHAHNPVNFFPWGAEALSRAKRLGRPILLSIGYSTCHWCHVMERESFEDEEIAAYLNQHYVSIKVDREERPDLDDVYMAAVQMMTGRGGWPMTVVLTPDLKPFFGGTYFPPRDGVRGARMGFLSILQKLRESFAEDPSEVTAHAERVSQAMIEAAAPVRPGAVPSYSAISAAASALARGFDRKDGGFGRAPKFPQPDRLTLLLRYYRRTEDSAALSMVVETLRAMAAGGMHDQVGGGFHRYSTDAQWLVPHFEKMLYDNALLTTAYLEGFMASGEASLASVVHATLSYVLREMTSPQGGFYSATDADSDTGAGQQEEGYHFTWTQAELKAALRPEQYPLVEQLYDVPEQGNFEGRTILARADSEQELAQRLGLSPSALEEQIEAVRQQLYEARKVRPYPGLDDKQLTAWNALMISALAQAGLTLERPEYTRAAERAADFVWNKLRDAQGKLLRSYHAGHARHDGYLEDYAFFIAALLDLFEATDRPAYLERALSLQTDQDAHFGDESLGGYFMTRDDGETLLVRDKPHYDGATPSGNAVAAMNLLRLSDLTSREDFCSRAEKTFAAFSEPMSHNSLGAVRMLAALDRYLDVPREVVIVHPDDKSPEALLATVRKVFLPNRTLIVASSSQLTVLSQQIPLLKGKVAIDGSPTAYVCERGHCELPTRDPDRLRAQLERHKPLEPLPDLLPR